MLYKRYDTKLIYLYKLNIYYIEALGQSFEEMALGKINNHYLVMLQLLIFVITKHFQHRRHALVEWLDNTTICTIAKGQVESVVHQARMEVTVVGVTAVRVAVATASTDHAIIYTSMQ